MNCPYCGSLVANVQVETIDLNSRQVTAISLVQKRGRITNRDVRREIPFWCTETIRLDLATLCHLGILEKCGCKKGTFYVLNQRP